MEQKPSDFHNIYTIAAGYDFFAHVIKFSWDLAQQSQEKLGQQLILVPSRRAAKSLQESYLDAFDGKPILAPTIRALGDLDADDLFLYGVGQDLSAALVDLPATIDPMKRLFVLADCIIEDLKPTPTYDQALGLASVLSRFLDEMITEGARFDDLKELVPENFSEHWQQTLSFLKIIAEKWPAYLKQENYVDAASYRHLLLTAQNKIWQDAPPKHPIIVAGITGTIPVVADLLKTISAMDNGYIFLPGLDCQMDEETRHHVAESHPQYGFTTLLDHLGYAWDDVQSLPQKGHNDLDHIMREMMRPQEMTEQWRDLESLAGDEQHRFTLIACDDQEEEARLCAYLLRETIENNNSANTPSNAPKIYKTIYLVTPDRLLARRVIALMQKWGVALDDSAGVPLHNTQLGVWLLMLGDLMGHDFNVIMLMAFLKHPLTGFAKPKGWLDNAVNLFEAKIIRRMKGEKTCQSILDYCAIIRAQDEAEKYISDELLDFFMDVLNQMIVFKKGASSLSLKNRLEHHLKFAEKTAQVIDGNSEVLIDGALRLWRFDEGEEASKFFAHLLETLDDQTSHYATLDYSALLKTLMQSVSVRSKFGKHPHVAVLGLMEARLLHADNFILAGLNEKTWPDDTNADPFLSRKMRTSLGLPTSDKAIGMAAHDFIQKLSADNVIMTRSKKVSGTPTIPSRWLMRLNAVSEKLGIDIHDGADVLARVRHNYTYAEDVKAYDRPAPRPPINARPTGFSVSGVETLMRNPYALYARKILSLSVMDPLMKKADYADRGQYIHAVLQKFTEKYPAALDDKAKENLLKIGAEILPEFCHSTVQYPFWWNRFVSVADFIVKHEQKWREHAKIFSIEEFGEMTITHERGETRLYAKADRIDIDSDNNLTIIDYKTGSAPSKIDIMKGFSPQLPLEAIIAESGGYSNGKKYDVDGLQHWILKKGEDSKIDSVDQQTKKLESFEDFLIETYDGVQSLMAIFADDTTPYYPVPRDDKAPKFDDYAHLSRRKEWGDM